MNEYDLTKRQWEAINNCIEAAGFTFKMFTRSYHSKTNENSFVGYTNTFPKIQFNKTKYYFLFKKDTRDMYDDSIYFISEYSPGATGMFVCKEQNSWNDQLRDVTDWLRYLKLELQAVDPWSRDNIDFEEFDSNADEKYTPEQAKLIENEINELHNDIISCKNLTQKINDKVASEFNYLKDKLTKLGRLDFLHVCRSVFFNLMDTLKRCLEEEGREFLKDTIRKHWRKIITIGPIVKELLDF